MRRIDDKLEHFAVDVMADVGEERRKLVSEVDDEIRSQYEIKEQEYLEKAYDIIQDALVKIDQQKSASLSRIIMNNRTSLFRKREEILESVYEKAEEKLRLFKKTEDYKQYLLARVAEAKDVLGQGDLWIKLDYSDRDLKSYLEEATDCHVEIASKRVSMLGGCLIHNRTTNTIADYAFTRKLEDAKAEFVQMCRLEID